jgi:enamine deaminase RidA (YjgF/YER057c/UK114 family)
LPSSRDISGILAARGFRWPPAIQPQGRYELVVVYDGIARTSGQVPRLDNQGRLLAGRVEADGDLEEARQAARLCLVRNLLALQQELGDLARVERLLALRGFIRAAPEFSTPWRGHGRRLRTGDRALWRRGPPRALRGGRGELPSGALIEIELTAAVRSAG